MFSSEIIPVVNKVNKNFILNALKPLNQDDDDDDDEMNNGFILSNSLRIDGRSNIEHRNIKVKSIGNKNGTILYSQGNTKILIGIKSELENLKYDNKGNVSIYCNFSPILRTNDTAQVWSNMIELIITSCIDLEALVVGANKCWHIRIDAHILNNDGNIIDSICTAMMIALKNYRYPQVSINGNNIIVYPTNEREAIPLPLSYTCYSFTFAIFENKVIIYDANQQEQLISKCLLTIAINNESEIILMQKVGGIAIIDEVIEQCLSIIEKKIISST